MGFCSFCLPCHSFLGHWEKWMLGWAWDALNEGSPHHHPHVSVDVCACMCSEAKHLHPKPKRRTRKKYLWYTFDTEAFMSQAQRTPPISAIKGGLSLPAVSFHLRALSCYFINALRLTGICFTSKDFSLYFCTRAKAELQVSTSEVAC